MISVASVVRLDVGRAAPVVEVVTLTGWVDRELDARASEDAVGARRHMGPLPLPPQSGMSASTVALTLSEL